jgi:signal transduction histidine kinase
VSVETGNPAPGVRTSSRQVLPPWLAEYDILDGQSIPELGTIVELAAGACDVPYAVINVLTADQQIQIAAAGFEKTVCRRQDAMCAVTVAHPGPVIVADARTDPRFAGNPFVNGTISTVRFYAATQLHGPSGHILGTLCVFDDQPRTLTPSQQDRLDQLAALVVDVLELRRRTRQLETMLTERDQAIREFSRLRAELERSNHALQQFAGTVAHDLRSPLATIAGNTCLLADDAQSCCPQILPDVTTITRATSRMASVIDDILDYASMGAEPQHCLINLGQLTADVIEDLSAALTAAHATVRTGELPTVRSDPTRIRLLLQNLLSNAIKFRHPSRPCHISIDAIARAHEWSLRIRDNGIGIPADHREQVLQPFVRLDQETSGHGIGLATCAEILRVKHGRLDIADTPGGGTTITATFPTLPGPSAPT